MSSDRTEAGDQRSGGAVLVEEWFSDRVQGEDFEFRKTHDEELREEHLNTIAEKERAQRALSKLSSDQLVTMAGAASGFVAGVVVCPLDVVKTRLQAQGALTQKHDTGCVPTARKYQGFNGAIKTIFKEEGVRGLYRGLVPITIGYLPTWTIYFSVYERSKRFYPQFLLNQLGISSDAISHFLSALTAGLASSIAVNPVWVVKTRLMMQTGQGKSIFDKDLNHESSKPRTYYKGTIDAFRLMYKEEGLSVFYSGLVPSLFGLLHVGIHFPVYEKLKEILDCNTKLDPSSGNKSILGKLIVASSLSKMVACTITYPHEILRTRMQIQSSEATHDRQQGKLLHSIIRIYHHEGFKGFYAGYFINLARTVPASAVTLVSFEYFKSYLLNLSGKL